MRFLYTAITLLLTSVAFSQTISSEVSQLPSCSLSCLTSAIAGAGCGLTDYACQCGSAKNAITTSATPCILKSCSTSDALTVQSITSEICVIQNGGGGAGSVPSSSTPAVAATSPSPSVSAIGSGSFSGGSRSTVTSPGAGAGATTSAKAGAGGTTTSPTIAFTGTTAGSTSSPATVTKSPGDRLQAPCVIAGAVALLALVL